MEKHKKSSTNTRSHHIYIGVLKKRRKKIYIFASTSFMHLGSCARWDVSGDPPPPPPFSPWSHFPFFSSTTGSVAVSASVLWPLICIPGGAKRRPQRRADKGHGRSPRGSMFATHPPRRHDTCRRPPSRHSHTQTHTDPRRLLLSLYTQFFYTDPALSSQRAKGCLPVSPHIFLSGLSLLHCVL